MKVIASLLAAAVVAGGFATPSAAAQFEANAQAESVIGDIIDGMIGHRYGNDRQAIRACGWAAVRRAENQYRRDFTGRPIAYPGYRGFVRVAAITDVQRRMPPGMVRVRGLLDTPRFGYGRGPRGADLTFRCDADRRGRVMDVRIDSNPHRWRG
jgi:hypothetical protein